MGGRGAESDIYKQKTRSLRQGIRKYRKRIAEHEEIFGERKL